MSDQITPDTILQLGFGFWGSKVLLSAVELGVFSVLAPGPLDAQTLMARLGLHPRSARDFLDALVALRLLERRGPHYANTPATDLFLDRAKPSYIGGILEMVNMRLYPLWGALTDALRTGQPQNETTRGENFFTALYADPRQLAGFLQAMTGLSLGTAQALAQKFPWAHYHTFLDVGTAQGGLPVQLALAHPHLSGGGFDLPPIRPIFEQYIHGHGLSDRVQFYAGDFFQDALPPAEVLIMGHILCDWNLDEKRLLLCKAYEALPPSGALIVYEPLIDDQRSENAFGLLMSLNMLIETTGGFEYTGADCAAWMRDAGFRDTRVEHLIGPDAMVVGIK
jgi:hypothetical protein